MRAQYEFVRGRRHSLDRRNKRVRRLTCKPPPWATFAYAGVLWDPEVLRGQLNQMLTRAKVSAFDVVRAWDRKGKDYLTRAEFTDEIRAFFSPTDIQQLWQTELEPVAGAAFDAMVAQGEFPGQTPIHMPDHPGVSTSVLQGWLSAAADTEDPPLKKGAKRINPRERRMSATKVVAARQTEAAQEAEMARNRRASREDGKASREVLVEVLHDFVGDIEREQQIGRSPAGMVNLRGGVAWASGSRLSSPPRCGHRGTVRPSTPPRIGTPAYDLQMIATASSEFWSSSPGSTARRHLRPSSSSPASLHERLKHQPPRQPQPAAPPVQINDLGSLSIVLPRTLSPGKVTGNLVQRPRSANCVHDVYLLHNGAQRVANWSPTNSPSSGRRRSTRSQSRGDLGSSRRLNAATPPLLSKGLYISAFEGA